MNMTWSPDKKIKVMIDAISGDQSIDELCHQHHLVSQNLEEWMSEYLPGGVDSLGEFTPVLTSDTANRTTDPIFIFFKDPKLNYVYANPLFISRAGFSAPDEIQGLTDYEFHWAKSEGELFRNEDSFVLNTHHTMDVLQVTKNASGQYFESRGKKVPLKSESGKDLGILGVYALVTTPDTTLHRLLHLIRNDTLNYLIPDAKYDFLGHKGMVSLTKREVESFLFLFKGYNAKETAKQMDISPRTVEFHIKNVKEKLGVSQKKELFDVILRNNWQKVFSTD